MEEYYDGVVAKPELDELYHHGVLGMHWGVKNGPPYPLGSDISTGSRLKTGAAGSVSKTKKRLAKASVKAAKANKKAAQSGNKILHPFKAQNKEKLQTKAFKEQAKVDRLQKKLLKEEKREDKAAERRDKMLEKEQRKLSNKDFDGDIDINRFKNDEAYADKVAHDKAKSANLDQGDNYKVYKNAIAGDKEAQKIVNQWEKKAAITKRLQNAKTRDQWDWNFLEATQNAPWTEAHTLGEMSDSAYKNKMLTEYKKYLQDPEEYWKRR